MKTTSITIYPDTKGMLDKIKDDYKYKTIDECVKNICQFITLNRFNPKTILVDEDNSILRSDIRMYFEDMRKFLRDDSQSMRKFLGALEKTYLKPLINKIENKDVLEAVDLAKPTPQEPAPKLSDLIAKNNASSPASSPVENSSEVEKLKAKIVELNKANKEALESIEVCKNVLKEISNNVEYVKSFTSSGYICKLNMKKEVFLELKERAGVI